MGYAYVKTVYSGTNVITLPFSYLSTDDVYLWVNDTLRPQSEITWTSASVVTITTAGLTTGDVILIARATNISSMNVQYSSGTQLTNTNLNNANTQLLYLNQETRDVTTLATATVVSEAQTAADTAVAAAVAAEASADEAAATVALLTPENILAVVKTVDGTGSGLDADRLDGNHSTAFATAAHNHTGVYQPLVYTGTVDTAAATAAKTCTISGYTAAAVGDLFAITFTLGNTAAAMTLDINGLGAVALMMNGLATTTVTATLAANATLLLYFDGTYLQLMGSQRISDSDLYDRMLYNSTVVMGAALYAYKLCLQAPDGKFYPITLETGTGTTKTVSTVEFNPDALMLHHASATYVASEGSPSSPTMYTTFNTNPAYYLNAATLTAGKPVYLKGTITSAGLFKLDNSTYTSFFTQTLPTSDDGYVYWYIGQAYSTTGLRMTEVHPMLYYKAGKLRVWSGVDAAMLLSELKTVDGVGSGLDADLLQGYTLADLVTYMGSTFAPLTHVSDTAAPHGAVSTNTASRIVTRDASGNFSAGTISANLTGTATSATYAIQLMTGRTINVSGDVTGSATSFNGTANITIPVTLTKSRAGAYAFRRLGNSGGTDNVTISAANGTATISFSTLSYSIGAGSAAALFTAPATGLYHFDVALRFLTTTNAATGLACGLQTPTNLFYGTCPIPDGTLTGDLFTCSVSIDEYLTAGGTVSVSALKLGAGSVLVDVGASWWSGHLVYHA